MIEDLRDVTAVMNKGITTKLSGLDRYNRLEANRKALIAECEKQANRTHQICSLSSHGFTTKVLQARKREELG